MTSPSKASLGADQPCHSRLAPQREGLHYRPVSSKAPVGDRAHHLRPRLLASRLDRATRSHVPGATRHTNLIQELVVQSRQRLLREAGFEALKAYPVV